MVCLQPDFANNRIMCEQFFNLVILVLLYILETLKCWFQIFETPHKKRKSKNKDSTIIIVQGKL